MGVLFVLSGRYALSQPAPGRDGPLPAGDPALQAPDSLRLKADTLIVRAKARPGRSAARDLLPLSAVDRQTASLAEVLERIPGLEVRRTGGAGSPSSLSLWGSAENQVNLYLDGVLQNGTGNPALLLGSLDLRLVERVEVYKGMAPAFLEGNPVGGAVNIVTIPDTETEAAAEAGAGSAPAGGARPGRTPPARARIGLGLGSFSAYRGSARLHLPKGAAGKRRRIELDVQALHDRAENDFLHDVDRGLEFLPGRDSALGRRESGDLFRERRENNAHALSQGLLRLRRTFSGENRLSGENRSLRLEGEVFASRLARELPSPFSNASRPPASPSGDSAGGGGTEAPLPPQSAAFDSRLGLLRLEASYRSRAFDQGLSLFGQGERDEYVDTAGPAGQLGLGRDHDRNTFIAGGLSSRTTLRPFEGFDLGLFGSYRADAHQYTARGFEGDPGRSGESGPVLYQYTGEGKIGPSFRRGANSILAAASYVLSRQDYYSGYRYDKDGRALPRSLRTSAAGFSAEYERDLGGGLAAALHGAKTYRLPSLRERFGDRGNFRGNPALRPEEGINIALTLKAGRPRFSASLRFFHAETFDAISLLSDSRDILYAVNLAETRNDGAELALHFRAFSCAKTDIAITTQTPMNFIPDNDHDYRSHRILPFRPLSTARIFQGLERGPFSLGLEASHQGLTLATPSNAPPLYGSYSRNLERQFELSASAAWSPGPWLLTVKAGNLTDERRFDYFGYPLPSRNFACDVSLRL